MVQRGKVLLRPDRPPGVDPQEPGEGRRELAARSCPMTSTFSAKQVRDGCGYTNSTHTNGNKKYRKKQANQKTLAKEKSRRQESLRLLKTSGFYLERWPSSRYPNTRVSFLILILDVSVFCGSQRTYGGSLLSSTMQGLQSKWQWVPLASEPFPRPHMHFFV